MFNSRRKGTHSELIMQICGVENLILAVRAELGSIEALECGDASVVCAGVLDEDFFLDDIGAAWQTVEVELC